MHATYDSIGSMHCNSKYLTITASDIIRIFVKFTCDVYTNERLHGVFPTVISIFETTALLNLPVYNISPWIRLPDLIGPLIRFL